MPNGYIYSAREYGDMVMCLGQANGNALHALRIYTEKFPSRRHPTNSSIIKAAFQRVLENRPIAPGGRIKTVQAHARPPRSPDLTRPPVARLVVDESAQRIRVYSGNSRSQEKGSSSSSADKAAESSGSNYCYYVEQNKKLYIKKPLNAFMLYVKEMRAKVVAACTLKESAAINQILGRRWNALGPEEKAKYHELARRERQLHMQLYSDWPSRANTQRGKKRKRKQETTDEGNIWKKCRARYGLDQQNKWCKPCRRKKKCARYMEALAAAAGSMSLPMVTPKFSYSVKLEALSNAFSDEADTQQEVKLEALSDASSDEADTQGEVKLKALSDASSDEADTQQEVKLEALSDASSDEADTQEEVKLKALSDASSDEADTQEEVKLEALSDASSDEADTQEEVKLKALSDASSDEADTQEEVKLEALSDASSDEADTSLCFLLSSVPRF